MMASREPAAGRRTVGEYDEIGTEPAAQQLGV
jgi:hypothetical protein